MNIKFFLKFVQLPILLLFTGCNEDFKTEPSQIQLNRNIFSTVQLYSNTLNKINLKDYFIDVNFIDSVKFLDKNLSIDSNAMVKLDSISECNFISYLEIFKNDQVFHIPVKSPRDQLLQISFKSNSKNVFIKGEFTNWLNECMNFKDGEYIYEKYVNPSVYQFCFVVDGVECLSDNYQKVPNGIGGQNCQIEISSNRVRNPNISFYSNKEKNTVFTSDIKDASFVMFYNNQLVEFFDTTEYGIIPIIPSNYHADNVTFLRAWAYTDYGCSKEILIPYKGGYPIMQAIELPKNDFHRQIIYNVFIDRFFDGNSFNNPTPLDSVLPPAQYLGGDLNGVLSKLKIGYFDSLGVNTLWLSPIVEQDKNAWGFWKNPTTKFSSYHGYWPISFTNLNPAFGSKEDFKLLIKQAHDKKIRVLLDVIANHIHKNHPLYAKHPEYFTSLYLPDGTLNTEKWDEFRLTTWFDVFMPSFDHEILQVRELLSDSLLSLINDYDLDGFRHDATKHVPSSFWKLLTYKIKKTLKNKPGKTFYQIGETYGSHKLVGSYVNSGQLDAQFDFNVYDAIMKVLCDDASFKILVDVINKSLSTYGDHHLMGNITGNQDKGRSISYLGNALSRNEDAKTAGWTRNIEIGDEDVAFRKMKIMHLINATIPGIPVLYYGDEIGMPGGNDPDSRRMMQFQDLNKNQQQLLKEVSKFLKLRNNSMALIYGTLEWVKVQDDVLIYKRIYGENEVKIYINKGMSKAKFFDTNKSIEIAPLSYKITLI